MALFIVGETKCAICGRSINTEAEAALFPAFLRPGHRLHRFSDGVFHLSCFNAWADREEFARLLSKFQYIMSTRPKGVSLEVAERWAVDAFRSMYDLPEE